jgi:hypothetical protein
MDQRFTAGLKHKCRDKLDRDFKERSGAMLVVHAEVYNKRESANCLAIP